MFRHKRLALIGLALLTTACAPIQTGYLSTTPTSQTLTIGDTQFTAGIDPAHDWEGWFTVRFGIGETLFRLDDQLEIEPWLAASYTSLDATTWQIQLKPNLTFSNGHPVTSEAVIASLQRLGAQHVSSEKFQTATYTVVDDRTFTIQTTEPSPMLMQELTDTKTAIVDASVTDQLVGTGPYMVKAFRANDAIDLVANPYYWQGKPAMAAIRYQYVPDPKTLAFSILAKQMDGGVDLSDDVMETFHTDSTIQQLNQATTRSYHLELSQEAIPDVRVRQAILAAIDKQSLTSQLLQGRVTPTNGAFPSTSRYGSGPFTNDGYQPDQAQALLQAAGYTTKNAQGILQNAAGEPLTLTLKTYKRLEQEKIATALQAQLKAVGIDLQVSVAEKVDGLETRDYAIALASAVTLPTGDPYYFLQASLASKGALNYVGNSDDTIEASLQQLHTLSESDAQRDLVAVIQQRAHDEALVDYIGFVNIHAAMQAQVRHFQLSPTDYYQITYETEKSND